jgi:predicted DNA-binding protein (UPF0251 family)
VTGGPVLAPTDLGGPLDTYNDGMGRKRHCARCGGWYPRNQLHVQLDQANAGNADEPGLMTNRQVTANHKRMVAWVAGRESPRASYVAPADFPSEPRETATRLRVKLPDTVIVDPAVLDPPRVTDASGYYRMELERHEDGKLVEAQERLGGERTVTFPIGYDEETENTYMMPWDRDADALAEGLAVYLAKLTPEQQEALRLLYWQGESYGSAAKLLGIAKSAFQARAERARAALQRTLIEEASAA